MHAALITKMCIVYILWLTQFKGDTPLILACTNGHLKLAILLIDHGAAVDYENMVRLCMSMVHGHDVERIVCSVLSELLYIVSLTLTTVGDIDIH